MGGNRIVSETATCRRARAPGAGDRAIAGDRPPRYEPWKAATIAGDRPPRYGIQNGSFYRRARACPSPCRGPPKTRYEPLESLPPYLRDKYGISPSNTCGNSSQGTFSNNFVAVFGFGPVFPPTNTSTASVTTPLILVFLPRSPISAAA